MAEIEEKTGVAEGQPLKGRAAWMERYKAANPDAGEEIDDEDLFEHANSSYSDLDGRHGQMTGANSRLAELVAEDPRFGAALSMVAGENRKSLPYAMGSVFGKDWIEGDLEEFESGYQEHLAQLAESRKLQEEAQGNIAASVEHISKYIADNQLSDEDAARLNENLVVFAENLLMGIVPPTLIELIHKGQNYEQDVQDAIETGAVEGKNERIEPELKKAVKEDVVDMGGASGSGAKRRVAKKSGGSFYDGIT